MAGPCSARRGGPLDGNITSFRSWFVKRESEEGVIAKTTAAAFAFASAAAAVSSGLQCIITVHSPSERREGGERESGRKRGGQNMRHLC